MMPKEGRRKQASRVISFSMPLTCRNFIWTLSQKEGEPGGPYGAKSLGECPVVPAAPAVVNAICNALGVEIDSLPANPEAVLRALGRG